MVKPLRIRPANVMAQAVRGPLFKKRVIVHKKRKASKEACRKKVDNES